MNFPSLVLFCIIWSTPSVCAEHGELIIMNLTRRSHQQHHHHHHHRHKQMNHNASCDNRSHGISEPRPWKNTHLSHNHRLLRTIHGTVNIIGWGVFLPLGVIIARHLRKASREWYSLHILSQLSGFLLGTLGWGIGISIKNSAKEHTLSTHGIMGTVIFAFAAFQLLAIVLRADEEHVCRKYWVIYHRSVGYALIVLIVANIFQGIKYQSTAERWEWAYGVILAILGVSALALELLKWISNYVNSS